MSQNNSDERCYGIKELAELGGVTRRTVRYYVQRGLLPTPLGTGRGPHYTVAHLERLIHIRKLQETGVPLAEITARLNGIPQTSMSVPGCSPEGSMSLLSKGETWMRFVLVDGVELHVRAGATNFQPWQLACLVEAVQQTLGLQTASHPSGRSKSYERNVAQLSDDVEPGLDSTPGGAH
jgi:DNA-binding transcriptional MerR regulator